MNLVLRIMEAYSSGDYTAVPSGTYGGTSFSSVSYSTAIDKSYKVAKERKAKQKKIRQQQAANGGSGSGGSASGGSSSGGSSGGTSTGGGIIPGTGGGSGWQRLRRRQQPGGRCLNDVDEAVGDVVGGVTGGGSTGGSPVAPGGSAAAAPVVAAAFSTP